MSGRYGTDKLNTTILISGAVICLIAMFIPVAAVKLTLVGIAYFLMFWAIFRCFSRNTYKRYLENKKFILMKERITDRHHKHFMCPNCHQPVRVPRGKGKICITCPRCKEKFIRKT